jgi:hypothetical protein
MSIDDQIDVGADQFKWEVYTEMLEVLDEELDTLGYQSRIVGTYDRRLLRVYGVDATESFPFLEHFIDLDNDESSNAVTMIHELSHNVYTQLANENDGFEERRFGGLENPGRLIESVYIRESSYLEEIGVKEELLGRVDEDVEIEELKSVLTDPGETPEDLMRQSNFW